MHDAYRCSIVSVFTESEGVVVALCGGRSGGPVDDIARQVEEEDEV